MVRAFRKYHRWLSLVLALPLFLTLITGIMATLVGEWSLNIGIPRSVLMGIHTGEIVGLQKFYPIMDGVGLLGLIVTGISMSGILRKRRNPAL
jgi:hypothetical protein